MEYVIIGIFVVIFIFLAGFFMKKKYFKEVDRLEAWKIDITSRPVLEELSKVKQLNMSGQTEESFERWRNEWDDIVTGSLPDLEDYLFDAEEYIDKYRFKKAKIVQQEITDKLTETEEKIKKLLAELNELVGSEEKNRIEIEELKEIYRQCKKTLLAHRYSYGRAEQQLEKRLEEVAEKFELFESHTENGNYLEAREVVLNLNGLLNLIKNHLEVIPDLLIECHSTIPSQLDELKDGYREMLEQGYILDHIQLELELDKLTEKVESCLVRVEQSELDNVELELEEVKGQIDVLYDLLEKEVIAKHVLEQSDGTLREMIQTIHEKNHDLINEVAQIKNSYHLQDKELEQTDKFEKRLAQLYKRYELLEHKVIGHSSAYTHLNDELQIVKQTLDEIMEEQSAFAEKLQALRKDELAAREQIADLRKKIADTIRTVSNSNVPGIPQDYKYLLEDAQESIKEVIQKLNEKPLDIPVVQQYLELAVLTVNKVTDITDELFDTVLLAEKVIQYGNRYRSRYPSVDKALSEAEQSFRSYEYKTALEQAASSIEEVEPGALKKIEELL
jgi:septation ring formation regulator